MRKAAIGVLFLALYLLGTPAGATSMNVVHAPKDYAGIKAGILIQRDSMAGLYAQAGPERRAALIASARKYVLRVIAEDLFPPWMGTPWDFNGISQKPGEGQIACGYFVTTILRDAGFGVERAKLAQQASLKIIRTVTPAAEIRDYGGIDVPELVRRMAKLPKGLYIVGLDIHTGFIANGEKSVDFIHASYGSPSVVVHEVALKSKVLAQSKRFVLGRVDNDEFLRKWLLKQAIPTLL
ncbi:MAG TPA: hypothetical protein VHS96_14020 [Bacteroidia bacterium]|nr:hypothetical protein [Bacteroidia bacterium]